MWQLCDFMLTEWRGIKGHCAGQEPLFLPGRRLCRSERVVEQCAGGPRVDVVSDQPG